MNHTLEDYRAGGGEDKKNSARQRRIGQGQAPRPFVSAGGREEKPHCRFWGAGNLVDKRDACFRAPSRRRAKVATATARGFKGAGAETVETKAKRKSPHQQRCR